MVRGCPRTGRHLESVCSGSQTIEDLWPGIYEDEIKSLFAESNPTPSEYTPPGNTAACGFAANGSSLYGGPITLTSYIWGYRGKPCPSK